MNSMTQGDAVEVRAATGNRLSRWVVAHPLGWLMLTAVAAALTAAGLTTFMNSAARPAATGFQTGRYRPGGAPARAALASARLDLGTVWGRAFAGRAPAHESLATAEAQANQPPGDASVDPARNTVRLGGLSAAVTIVADPPNGRDMAFRAAGLENPTIVVRRGARVAVRFINGDSDSAHGWLLLDPIVQIGNTVHGPRAFPGAYAPILGDPTSAGQPAETITFRATQPGTYRYECPVPGHAAMGMQGSLVVSG